MARFRLAAAVSAADEIDDTEDEETDVDSDCPDSPSSSPVNSSHRRQKKPNLRKQVHRLNGLRFSGGSSASMSPMPGHRSAGVGGSNGGSVVSRNLHPLPQPLMAHEASTSATAPGELTSPPSGNVLSVVPDARAYRAIAMRRRSKSSSRLLEELSKKNAFYYRLVSVLSLLTRKPHTQPHNNLLKGGIGVVATEHRL